MKTRISDFYNTTTGLPEYSFQYEELQHSYPRWVYVARSDGQPMRWHTAQQRNSARLLYSSRRHPLRALCDLQALNLHLNQPGQAEASTATTATTTTESHA